MRQPQAAAARSRCGDWVARTQLQAAQVLPVQHSPVRRADVFDPPRG